MPRRFSRSNSCGVCKRWLQDCVSICVVVSTMGTRDARRQGNSGAVKFCGDCMGKLLKGRIPAALLKGLKDAHQRLEAGI